MRTRRCCLSVVTVLILCLPAWAEQPFFAFDNAFRQEKLPVSEQAAILAELGYDGIGYTGTQNIPQSLSALKAHNLRMFSTYVGVDLSANGTGYDPDLPKAIQQLKGEGTILWLYVRAKAKPLTLDDRAVTAIRDIARMAEESGLQIAIYPHYKFYVGTIEDALRVAKKVDRKNVGVAFNLCHFLKQHDEEEIKATLAEAMPHLFLVSINGVDRGDTKSMGWDRLIQPLGKGDFAVENVLRILRQEKYSGAIGLQCYAIPGKPQQHLKQSIEAWRTIAKQLDDEK
ncbi:MAG: sugar phosphate isomerase/epimerase [Planctomycetes bacterium]|nr:sugar phosphate isomerase/epimerase [Planctomycetota bacterium]